MKNFKLVKGSIVSKGMVLIHLESKTIYPQFSSFISMLVRRGLSNHTIESYADHTAHFLDFMFEVQLQPKELIEDFQATSIFDLYYEYLAFGLLAENQLTIELARTLNKTVQISNKTISGQITSALDYFLHHLSAEYGSQFLDNFQVEYYINTRQQEKFEKYSWFAQCIRATENELNYRSKKTGLFPRARRSQNIMVSDSSNTYEKAFPSNEAFQFLLKQKSEIDHNKSLTKSRAYLLDSLQAASGVRISEALQVLVGDINIENKTIKIVPVNKRTYKGLTESEANKLVFKGRNTEKTLLIEPFATLFWDALKTYLQKYYKRNMNHNFLFQKSNGRPWFSGDNSQRCKDMKARLRKYANSDFAEKYSSHSFRHMYGIYTFNHLPIISQDDNTIKSYGLPLSYVKILMGHADIKSTEQYGRKDSSVTEVLITLANNKIRHSGLSLKDIIMDVKTKKLEEIQIEFEKLESKGVSND
ncbi:tyrosine-type recombinase/integrase [Vibrio cyclitrophicus]